MQGKCYDCHEYAILERVEIFKEDDYGMIEDRIIKWLCSKCLNKEVK